MLVRREVHAGRGGGGVGGRGPAVDGAAAARHRQRVPAEDVAGHARRAERLLGEVGADRARAAEHRGRPPAWESTAGSGCSVKLKSSTATRRGPGGCGGERPDRRPVQPAEVVDGERAVGEPAADAELHAVPQVLAPAPEAQPRRALALAQRVVVLRLLGAEVVRVRELERSLERHGVAGVGATRWQAPRGQRPARGGQGCGGGGEASTLGLGANDAHGNPRSGVCPRPDPGSTGGAGSQARLQAPKEGEAESDAPCHG